MSISIPSKFEGHYNEKGYYLSRGHDFGNNPREYIERYAASIGQILCQENADLLSKDIRPIPSNCSSSPSSGNQSLGLHTDGFFKEERIKPEVNILLCVSPGEGEEGKPIISDIVKTVEEYNEKYGIEAKKKLLNTRLRFNSESQTFMFGDIGTQIFQEFDGDYMNGPLYSNGFFSLMDGMERSDALVDFQVMLNKNTQTLERLIKGDIICTNNMSFAHGRTGPISKDRHLIRVHIR